MESKTLNNSVKSKHILVIEDDEFLREMLVKKLAESGYKVSEAITGEDGLAKLKELRPDFLILDLILPGIDGFEVLTKLKSDNDTANIPVLILSNYGQKEDIKRGLDLGAIDYLIKSHLSPSQIIEKVNKFINSKK